MKNILTNNKTIRQMSNRQFVNHIFNTSVSHEVILMKIIDDGIKATLSNKGKILKEWEDSSEETKESFINSLDCTAPGYFNLVEEIKTAYNLKYKLR